MIFFAQNYEENIVVSYQKRNETEIILFFSCQFCKKQCKFWHFVNLG